MTTPASARPALTEEQVEALILALTDLLDYTGQLEMLVYAADDIGPHEVVAQAQAALSAARPPRATTSPAGKP